MSLWYKFYPNFVPNSEEFTSENSTKPFIFRFWATVQQPCFPHCEKYLFHERLPQQPNFHHCEMS